MVSQSRKVLLALVVKFNSDWNQIYDFISNRININDKEIDELVKKVTCNYVCILDEEYPKHLLYYYHPPFVLFYYGDISLIKENTNCLGVVGSRKNSEYGERCTRKFVKEVSKYLTIVSGLAYGIDSIAASECLKNGGKTVAVLGSGIDYCYPFENKNMYEEIKKKGLLISEYYGSTMPSPEKFPQRNRIIAGLSKNLLIPEAKKNSGTSITATFAIEMGQTVFCIPERVGVDSLPNYLISCGAKITLRAEDILEEYNIRESNTEFDL